MKNKQTPQQTNIFENERHLKQNWMENLHLQTKWMTKKLHYKHCSKNMGVPSNLLNHKPYITYFNKIPHDT